MVELLGGTQRQAHGLVCLHAALTGAYKCVDVCLYVCLCTAIDVLFFCCVVAFGIFHSPL